MKKKLENKIVLITGYLSEIGKACALAAIREGANVVIADINSDTTERLMEEIKEENANALFIPCDVSKFDEVQHLVKNVVKKYETIDVALNNSSIECEIYNTKNMSKNDWLKVIGCNLNGVFNCMSHQLPEMAKQKKGIILNMASVLGKPDFLNSSHYIATKHGIIGLTKTAALEYAIHGVRINALCPGFFDKSFSDTTSDEMKYKQEMNKSAIELSTIKKIAKEEEIANGFIFMASEKSPFITGTAVEIDGGYLSQ